MDPSEIRAVGEIASSTRRSALVTWGLRVAMHLYMLKEAELAFDLESDWYKRARQRLIVLRARNRLRATQRKRDRFARSGSVPA